MVGGIIIGMKKIFIFLIFLLFSASSFAEQYSNSWKMNIQCKNGGDKWYEAHFVVDVIDDEFTLDLSSLVRWGWQKNIIFEGKINKNKVIIKQKFEWTDGGGLGIGVYKGKIKDNKAKLKGYNKWANNDPLSCNGEFLKVDSMPTFGPLEYLDQAIREVIEFTSYNPSYPVQIMNKSYLKIPVKISGELILPPSGDNLPVVVVVHSSGGPSEFTDVSQWTWRNGFNNELLKNNIGIFQIDSFTGRGAVQTVDDQSKVVLHAGEMDALIAHKILSKHPRIDGKRLGITGLSRGGMAATNVVEKRYSDAVLGPDSYFKASLPMAIDCWTNIFENPMPTPTKTLWLLGADDDYTPPDLCISHVEKLKAQGADVEILIKDGWVHDFYADTPIEICKDCVIFNNEACSANLPKGLTYNDEGIPSKEVFKYFSKINNKSIEELMSIATSEDTTWEMAYQIFYDMYKSMYFDCATKGPKIGGDHAQETIDIAVPFFVNALK